LRFAAFSQFPFHLQHQDSLVFTRGRGPFFGIIGILHFKAFIFGKNVIPERFPTQASFFSSSSSLASHLGQVFHEVLSVVEPKTKGSHT